MSLKRAIFRKDKRSAEIHKEYSPNILITLILFFIIMYASGILALLLHLVLSSINYTGVNGRVVNATLNNLIIPFGMNIVGFFLWVKLVQKEAISSLGFEKEYALSKYIKGFFIGFFMITFSAMVLSLMGMLHIDYVGSYRVGVKAFIPVFITLIGWIVQGASEEIMIRGWLLNIISRRYNFVVGVIITSTLFGFLHIFNPNVSKLAIINIILFGIFAALYKKVDESLWGICAVHTAWNWAQGNVYGIQISGTLPLGGMLFKLKAEGPKFFTGGSFGLEGGIIVSVVLFVSILVLIWIIKGKNRTRVN